MSLLKKMFGLKDEPKKRVRICVECGMPIAEHKEWCSILRIRQDIERRETRRVAPGEA